MKKIFNAFEYLFVRENIVLLCGIILVWLLIGLSVETGEISPEKYQHLYQFINNNKNNKDFYYIKKQISIAMEDKKISYNEYKKIISMIKKYEKKELQKLASSS